MKPWHIQVGDDVTHAQLDEAPHVPRADDVFVCAHGAGGNMDDRAMLALGGALRDRGLSVVRFNFFYADKKSKRPDRMPRLMECTSAVVERVRAELRPRRLFIGGRSMGGRAASMMAAEGFPCDALLLYAYPLHPAGHPEKLRDAHLPAITVPVLCVNGTRDTLCTRALMERAVKPLGTRWRQVWIDDADHGFHVTKASGTSDGAVVAAIAAATADFVAGLA